MGKSAFYERGFSGEGLTVGSSLITSHYFKSSPGTRCTRSTVQDECWEQELFDL